MSIIPTKEVDYEQEITGLIWEFGNVEVNDKGEVPTNLLPTKPKRS